MGNLDDLNDLYLVRTNDVIKIIVYNTGYYASGGSYKEKMIYNFDDSVKIAGKRFKEDQICSNFEYKLDDSKRIIPLQLERLYIQNFDCDFSLCIYKETD